MLSQVLLVRQVALDQLAEGLSDLRFLELVSHFSQLFEPLFTVSDSAIPDPETLLTMITLSSFDEMTQTASFLKEY